jgi:GGDEF domain-containing protein
LVVVGAGVTAGGELVALAARVIAAVNGPITLPEVGRTARPPQRIRVGISVGVGVVAADRSVVVDPDRLLTLADSAMYRAKAQGGTTSVIDHLD